MAAPMESIAFCKIVNEANLLDVAGGCEEDSILVTNKGKSCNIYKVFCLRGKMLKTLPYDMMFSRVSVNFSFFFLFLSAWTLFIVILLDTIP